MTFERGTGRGGSAKQKGRIKEPQPFEILWPHCFFRITVLHRVGVVVPGPSEPANYPTGRPSLEEKREKKREREREKCG